MKKVLLIILITFIALQGVTAEEHYNVPVVEYFERQIGYNTWAFIGISTNNSRFTDIFIVITHLNLVTFNRRLANIIRDTGVVSIQDSEKTLDATLAAYTIGTEDILEIGGLSVLYLFPGTDATDFPHEAARQARLRSQNRN